MSDRELTKSEFFYRKLFEGNPVPMCIYDKDSLRILAVNAAMVQCYGYATDEFTSMTIDEIRAPERKKGSVGNNDKQGKTALSYQRRERHKKKDGTVLDVDVTSTFIATGDDKACLLVCSDVSERVAAQRALAESEERFRTAFHTSPDAVAISRLEDGILLEVNQGFLDLTGFTRGEVAGKSAADLGIWPQDETRSEWVREHQVDGRVKNLELVLRRKDKDPRDVMVSTGTIQLEGRPHLLTVARDVTEIKGARHALEVSEEKFRTAFVISPDAVTISRLSDGCYIDVNESFLRITGYKREEVIGKTSFEINLWIAPEDRKRLIDAMEEKGYTENLEMRYRMRDGSHLDTLTSARIMDLEGVKHLICISRDFTQIKKAQDTLKESEERFRAAFDVSPDAILLIDIKDRRISHVNDSFVSRSGFSKEEVLGKTTEDLSVWMDPEGREQFYDVLKDTGVVDGFEGNFRLNNGTISKSLISARPMEWAGRPHILVTLRDITGIVETRNRLQTSLAEKDILLKEVHHRVKNNLQVISSLLNLQALHMGDEQGKMTYRESQNRVHTMALIHEELYRSSNLSQVDFSEYLNHLCGNIFSSYGISMGRIRCDLDIREREVVVDTAIPCGLIVNELITNSLKHAFPNGREGVVSVFFKRVTPLKFQLVVSDNGVGIPHDIDIHKSISLGLQLVSVLVQQLGGTLEVETGEGTTFRMILKEYHEAGTTLY